MSFPVVFSINFLIFFQKRDMLKQKYRKYLEQETSFQIKNFFLFFIFLLCIFHTKLSNVDNFIYVYMGKIASFLAKTTYGYSGLS